MKSRTWMWTTAVSLFAALAMAVGMAAQDNPSPEPQTQAPPVQADRHGDLRWACQPCCGLGGEH